MVNAHRLAADVQCAAHYGVPLRVRVLTEAGRVLVVDGVVVEVGTEHAILRNRDGRRQVVRLADVLPPLERRDGRVFAPKSNDNIGERAELRAAEDAHQDAGGLEP